MRTHVHRHAICWEGRRKHLFFHHVLDLIDDSVLTLPIRLFPQRSLVLRRENGSCCVMQRVQARAAGLSLFCYHHNLVQVKQRLLEVCCSRMLGRANLFAGELIWANPCPGESVSGRIRSGRIRGWANP